MTGLNFISSEIFVLKEFTTVHTLSQSLKRLGLVSLPYKVLKGSVSRENISVELDEIKSAY